VDKSGDSTLMARRIRSRQGLVVFAISILVLSIVKLIRLKAIMKCKVPFTATNLGGDVAFAILKLIHSKTIP